MPLNEPARGQDLESVSTTPRKIFGPTRMDAPSSADYEYALVPASGGSRCKNVVYAVRIIEKSSDDVRFGLGLEHGPGADLLVAHSTPLAVTTLGATYSAPFALVGATDTGTDGPFGEWLRVVMTCGSVSGSAWLIAEVMELRKPF